MSSHNIWIVPTRWEKILAAVARMAKRGDDVSYSTFVCRGIDRELEAEEARTTVDRSE